MIKFTKDERATLISLAGDLDQRPFEWLAGRSFSDAFVICIGAGPWKIKRRKDIQGRALQKLAGRKLEDLPSPINWYPFKWQNDFVNNMRKSVQQNEGMDKFCLTLQCAKCTDPKDARQKLFDAAGCPKGSKVLSLFCRDALGIPSFPIDRHVKRFLTRFSLPTDERSMIELCFQENFDPRNIAVGFVRAASDMDNPDWSTNVQRQFDHSNNHCIGNV